MRLCALLCALLRCTGSVDPRAADISALPPRDAGLRATLVHRAPRADTFFPLSRRRLPARLRSAPRRLWFPSCLAARLRECAHTNSATRVTRNSAWRRRHWRLHSSAPSCGVRGPTGAPLRGAARLTAAAVPCAAPTTSGHLRDAPPASARTFVTIVVCPFFHTGRTPVAPCQQRLQLRCTL